MIAQHIVVGEVQDYGTRGDPTIRVNWLVAAVFDGQEPNCIDSSWTFDKAMDLAREYDQQWESGMWHGPE